MINWSIYLYTLHVRNRKKNQRNVELVSLSTRVLFSLLETVCRDGDKTYSPHFKRLCWYFQYATYCKLNIYEIIRIINIFNLWNCIGIFIIARIRGYVCKINFTKFLRKNYIDTLEYSRFRSVIREKCRRFSSMLTNRNPHPILSSNSEHSLIG